MNSDGILKFLFGEHVVDPRLFVFVARLRRNGVTKIMCSHTCNTQALHEFPLFFVGFVLGVLFKNVDLFHAFAPKRLVCAICILRLQGF